MGVSCGGHIDLVSALASLGRLEINEVLVECGPRLAGAFLQAGLVDELLVYLAPSLLGHEGRPLAEMPGLRALHQKISLEFLDVKRIGSDCACARVRSRFRRRSWDREGGQCSPELSRQSGASSPQA